jgi:hypothetical protein
VAFGEQTIVIWVRSGRLDHSRDWFATTPAALLINGGIIISAKESVAAETPDPPWLKPC